MSSSLAPRRRGAKRAVLDTFQLLCEGAWALGFRPRPPSSASLDPRPSPASERPETLRVLAVSPHPDDEMAGCGGALLLHRRAGHRAAIVQGTDGRRSRAFGLDPQDMARRRRREAEAAAELLEVERLDWLGLPEGAWNEDDAVAQLADILGRWRPQLIYTPSRIDFHREHLRVARALARALEIVSLDGWARCYQVQVPLTAVLVNCTLDIGEVGDDLQRGLELYRTQYGSLERCLRVRRYAGRRRAWRLCEEHWQLPIPTFVDLHRALDTGTDRTSFRSLRYLALSDPLAYVLGRRERLRLARLTSSLTGEVPSDDALRTAAQP